MKYYHGTSEKNWLAIKESGYLLPNTADLRLDRLKNSLHLADGPDIAKKYGSVVLEIEWDGDVIPANQGNSLATFNKIPISNIKRLSEAEIRKWTPYSK